MQLLLTPTIIQHLQRELRKAGRREIGGLLMGEHLQGELFRVVDLTVQHSGGTTACFIRHPHEHQAELDQFFERTGADYTRYNYLGEWHSHPSFAPVPSATDAETMQSIVSDASVGVNFLILLIVKRARRQTLQVTATAFRPGTLPIEVGIVLEETGESSNALKMPRLQWIWQLFRR